ncbi:hypothetical protein S14_123 [Shewanella sp. phage 1/4]|uniref:hypothetical protein n=1 Tax=Shewanella phage 1/4 TaxID=1458859 RepID=UPI0004F5C424|nr:hypothetical protein S14_123 [Shewanella sp. phage 1/4]AHK11232.1 hypothetical protein S14_123 [Shewanella sp. phage 1/4]
MGFSTNEISKLSAKVLAAGVIDSLPTANWYESRFPNSFLVDPDNILNDIGVLRDFPASSAAAALAAVSANSTTMQSLGFNPDASFDPNTAVRLTPVAGTNRATYVAYATFNDPTSKQLKNWIQPQLIQQPSGAASNGYSIRVFVGGAPTAGGVELTTTVGLDIGGEVGWFFNYANGLLLFSTDVRPPSGFVGSDEIWVCGFRYVGETGGGGETIPEYTEVYLGQDIKAGDKFSNYGGVIAVRDHVGVWPMDIFSGVWNRIGDDRTFRFEGTDQEKLTRLLPSYEQDNNPIAIPDTAAIYTQGVQAPDVFITANKAEPTNNSVWSTGDDVNQIVPRYRIYCYVGNNVPLNGFVYQNAGDTPTGVKDIVVYVSDVEPSQRHADSTNLTEVFVGTMNARASNVDQRDVISFDQDYTGSWVTIDTFSNHGDPDFIGLNWVEFFSGNYYISTVMPTVGAFTKYNPVWGDNLNEQGVVILNSANTGHGATEWAFSEANKFNTLHDSEYNVLTDSNGALIVFNRSPRDVDTLVFPIGYSRPADEISEIERTQYLGKHVRHTNIYPPITGSDTLSFYEEFFFEVDDETPSEVTLTIHPRGRPTLTSHTITLRAYGSSRLNTPSDFDIITFNSLPEGSYRLHRDIEELRLGRGTTWLLEIII